MSNHILLYHYAPTWDFPPNGPIQIGNVLKSIEKPEEPIARIPPPPTFKLEKFDSIITDDGLKQGQFSILTRFLSVFKFGGGAGSARSTGSRYSIQRIVTEQFVADDDIDKNPERRASYWQQCVNMPRVKQFLANSGYKSPIYIITGIKIAHGASAESLTSRSRSGQVEGGLDGTAMSGGVPAASLEVNASLSSERSTGMSWGGSDAYVLAFRVRKLTADEITGEVRDRGNYNPGAVMGNEREESEGDCPRISVLTMEDPDDEGYDKLEETEGNGRVLCAFCKKLPLQQDDSKVV